MTPMKVDTSSSYPPGTIVISIPLVIRSRGGRKLVISPGAEAAPIVIPSPDTTLIKAIARAFRWQRLLEEGTFASITELAHAEKISSSYVSRILRLTLLEPTLIEAIVGEGRLDQ